ncbi:MAG TPA: hypothetical protein VE046_14865 [Steroidobacteraceae bacterium]|nr:hypothetical protein [Steroidobacteraceae bacterium]
MMERSSEAYKIPFLVGVVGHRDLVAGELAQIRAAVAKLLARLKQAYPDVTPTLLTSLAEGADLIAAEVAAELGIAVTAVLPMPADVCRADLTTDEARASFDRIIARSERLEVAKAPANPDMAGDTTRVRRDLQFQRAGMLVARYSTLLIVIWDGRETDHRAGTARVVEYRRRGLAANGDDDQPGGSALLSIQDNDLIYEIRCSRHANGNANGDGSASAPNGVEVRGFTGAGAASREDIPESLATVLGRLAEFNRDVDEFAESIEKKGRRLSLPSPTPLPEKVAYLDRLFRAADWLGGYYRGSFTLALRTRYTLWALMAFLLVSFKKESAGVVGTVTILGVLAVFAIGYVFARWAHRSSWHRKYLDYRALAEGLRVEFYWEIAGVHALVDGGFAHESFLQKQDVELEWIRTAMRAVSLRLAVANGGRLPGGYEQAYAGWVGDADPVNGSGQLLYYRQRIDAFENRLHLTERVGLGLLFAGLGLAVIFGLEMLLRRGEVEILPQGARSLMLWGLALLPVYAVIFETYVSDKADRALIREYRYMYSLFGLAARELRIADSEHRKLEILRSLGYACLSEHAQWILGHRDKRIEGLRW